MRNNKINLLGEFDAVRGKSSKSSSKPWCAILALCSFKYVSSNPKCCPGVVVVGVVMVDTFAVLLTRPVAMA